MSMVFPNCLGAVLCLSVVSAAGCSDQSASAVGEKPSVYAANNSIVTERNIIDRGQPKSSHRQSDEVRGRSTDAIVFRQNESSRPIEDSTQYGDISAELDVLPGKYSDAMIVAQRTLESQMSRRFNNQPPQSPDQVQEYIEAIKNEPEWQFAMSLGERLTELRQVTGARLKAAERRYRISGHIVDESGLPIPDVTLTIVNCWIPQGSVEQEQRAVTKTITDGQLDLDVRFTVPNSLNGGWIVLKFHKDGFGDPVGGPIELIIPDERRNQLWKKASKGELPFVSVDFQNIAVILPMAEFQTLLPQANFEFIDQTGIEDRLSKDSTIGNP